MSPSSNETDLSSDEVTLWNSGLTSQQTTDIRRSAYRSIKASKGTETWLTSNTFNREKHQRAKKQAKDYLRRKRGGQNKTNGAILFGEKAENGLVWSTDEGQIIDITAKFWIQQWEQERIRLLRRHAISSDNETNQQGRTSQGQSQLGDDSTAESSSRPLERPARVTKPRATSKGKRTAKSRETWLYYIQNRPFVAERMRESNEDVLRYVTGMKVRVEARARSIGGRDAEHEVYWINSVEANVRQLIFGRAADATNIEIQHLEKANNYI